MTGERRLTMPGQRLGGEEETCASSSFNKIWRSAGIWKLNGAPGTLPTVFSGVPKPY